MLRRPVTSLLLVFAVLYAAASVWHSGVPDSYWGWRYEWMMGSGVLLMAAMSAAVVLAARPVWLEQRLRGLDKLYGLHKRLGIAAAALLAIHWLVKLSPKLVLALGLAERRARHGGGRDALASLAKDMGEWAAWAVLALVALALLRMVPYRFWRKTHKLFAPFYLMGAFHTVVLAPGDMWLQPAGWLLAPLMAAGVGCAVYSMLGRIGRPRRFAGEVARATPLPGRQLEVICRMGRRWPGHAAGQFALVCFDEAEGAHPFTIASADQGDGELRFIIKSLGDYTATLADSLRPGQAVTVEGPYGCFDLRRGGQRQAWVAGGIGVTPFLAWLQSREPEEGYDIDFYYCVRSAGEAARLDEVRQACQRHGIRLHLIAGDTGAQLEASMLPQVEDVWFCGPQGLGAALRRGLAARGALAPRLHQEAFSMR
ncbi:reductase [Xenophilus sp. AP218F]|nr:reductase [Xenophilus sp. AP218F]